MAQLTDQQYYENPDLWGQSGFVTLQNVIDNILLKAGDDSYFKHSERFRMSIIGKQGIKKLNVDLKSQNKAISIQLSPSKIFPFPKYMTNWSRVSVLNDCGKLVTLNVNNKPQIQDYLQDHEWKLLYDCHGNVLEGACFDAEQGDCCLEFQDCESTHDDCGCGEKDFSDSWVKENREGGYFQFSDCLVDRIIVIEFQCAGLDGLDDCDIKIHDALELVVEYWIKWKTLEGNRNVPLNQIEMHRREYKREKNRAESLLADKISIEQIIKSVSLRYNQ